MQFSEFVEALCRVSERVVSNLVGIAQSVDSSVFDEEEMSIKSTNRRRRNAILKTRDEPIKKDHTDVGKTISYGGISIEELTKQ